MPIDINELLKKTIQMGASDLHVKAGSAPIVRIHGALSFMQGEKKLTSEDTLNIALSVMSGAQQDVFKKKNDIDKIGRAHV